MKERASPLTNHSYQTHCPLHRPWHLSLISLQHHARGPQLCLPTGGGLGLGLLPDPYTVTCHFSAIPKPICRMPQCKVKKNNDWWPFKDYLITSQPLLLRKFLIAEFFFRGADNCWQWHSALHQYHLSNNISLALWDFELECTSSTAIGKPKESFS